MTMKTSPKQHRVSKLTRWLSSVVLCAALCGAGDAMADEDAVIQAKNALADLKAQRKAVVKVADKASDELKAARVMLTKANQNVAGKEASIAKDEASIKALQEKKATVAADKVADIDLKLIQLGNDVTQKKVDLVEINRIATEQQKAFEVAEAAAAKAAEELRAINEKVREAEENIKLAKDGKAESAEKVTDAVKEPAPKAVKADKPVKAAEQPAEDKAAANVEKTIEPVVLPWKPAAKEQLPVALQGGETMTVPEAKTANIVDENAVMPQFDVAMVSGDRDIVEKLPIWKAWKEYVEFNKVSPKDINEFHGKLVKALQEKGYVFAQVEFPTRIWSTGIFLAKVDCGQLGDITVRNSKYYSAKQIVRALENKEGRFNYSDIHSDLFDLNAKPDLKLQTALKPVQQGGRRVINADIEVEDKLPIHGAIELSNSAAKDAANDWRVRTTLQHLNITKHNDSLTVDWLTTGKMDDDMNAISASYFLPVNDNLFFNVYGGWNSSHTDDVLPEISVRGRGAFAGLQFSYILHEDALSRYQLSLGWFYQRLTNYNDIKTNEGNLRISNGDITLSMPSITLGYTQKVFDAFNGRNFASITIQQNRAGTFGSSSKSAFIAASATEGDFTIGKFQAARYQRLFEGEDHPGKWTLFAKVDGQIASDRMPSMTREYVGGRNSVRGYEESEVNGDHAVVGTLELRTPLLENFIPGLKKDADYMKENPEYWGMHRLQLLFFTDFGYVSYDDKQKADDDNGLWSVGAGIRLGLTKYSQMALDYGYPILDASDDTPDGGRVHVSIQLQF